MPNPTPRDAEVILILAPSANDGNVACEVLHAEGLVARVCSDVFALCHQMGPSCGAVIISAEAVDAEAVPYLEAALDRQEAWSDLPIIVLTRDNVVQTTEVFSKSGNISILERPFSRFTLVRAVEVALRARRKQYQVRDLLEDLRSAKDESERANVAKTQFLANMSHEIRTPIGAIMGFIDLMKFPENTPEENLSYMGIVERNSHQLLRLIDDILDLSKVEVGKMTIECIPFKLTDLLADFGSIMTFRAGEKGITFRTVFETLVPDFICSDPVRLRQILSNVVGNALKFTDDGSVELKISYDQGHLRFLVKDTGVGLTREQSSRLFQPFSQADASTTRKFGGTGLGLVLSRRLAEALGGNLQLLHSSPGGGSTFAIHIKTFMVPHAQLVGENSLLLESSPSGTKFRDDLLHDLKVLLVEDSPDNQKLITTYLRQTGVQIKSASDGVEGVASAMNENFDVVLMDVQMPLMDGHEATRKLRKSRYDKPIVALTAHAMMEERTKCFESGFTDFLSKPIRPDQLIAMLSRYSTH